MGTKFSIEIDDDTIDVLWQFCHIDNKDSMLAKIENVIRINTVTGVVREFELEQEMSLLYEVKDLIQGLPISD